MQMLPSPAAATCLMHTSKPTVALPSARFSKARIDAQRSILEIIPGVESTFTGSVPPTSVSSRPSAVNSSVRSMPGSMLTAPGIDSTSTGVEPSTRSSRIAIHAPTAIPTAPASPSQRPHSRPLAASGMSSAR